MHTDRHKRTDTDEWIIRQTHTMDKMDRQTQTETDIQKDREKPREEVRGDW